MENKTLIKDDSEIYNELDAFLKSFLLKWPIFVESVELDFLNLKQLYRNGIFIIQLSGKDRRYNSDVKIRINALKNGDYHEDVFYSFRVDISKQILDLFNKGLINPESLYASFYDMAEFTLGVICPSTDTVELSFDSQCEIEEIMIMVKNMNRQTATDSFAHRLYDLEHIKFANRNHVEQFLDPTNIEYFYLNALSHFYFLWKRTNFFRILVSNDFTSAFKCYIQDVERYHLLIKMDTI